MLEHIQMSKAIKCSFAQQMRDTCSLIKDCHASMSFNKEHSSGVDQVLISVFNGKMFLNIFFLFKSISTIVPRGHTEVGIFNFHEMNQINNMPQAVTVCVDWKLPCQSSYSRLSGSHFDFPASVTNYKIYCAFHYHLWIESADYYKLQNKQDYDIKICINTKYSCMDCIRTGLVRHWVSRRGRLVGANGEDKDELESNHPGRWAEH